MRLPIIRLIVPLLFGAFLFAVSLGSSSCKKEQLLVNGGELKFSTDTLSFDTVFTSLGSATVGVKIFNPQNQKITIASVHLANGASSPFHLNVDGKAGDGTNIDVAAGDSIYVFATVKVDPTDVNSPFIIQDRLVANLNGNDFSIPVIAYGQNAHYIRDSVLETQTWKTDKPYVIFGYAFVDSLQTLTIPAGCRIYMHANARLFVGGTLNATGTKKDSIIFQGDRLDRSYYGFEGYPGEWGGIYFLEYSTDSYLEHVVLANCGNSAQNAAPAAVQVSPDAHLSHTIQLTMNKVVIQNSIGYGLLCFNGSVKATNCLINSCGASALALLQGGNYQMDNCTITTYGSNKINHNDNPVAAILNYYFYNQTQYYSAPLTARFHNCAITGSLDNEVFIDSLKDAAATVNLSSCLIKQDPTKIRPWVTQSGNLYALSDGTMDPLYTDISKFNYRPLSNSPLLKHGTPPAPIDDLDDVIRSSPTSIGCYDPH